MFGTKSSRHVKKHTDKQGSCSLGATHQIVKI